MKCDYDVYVYFRPTGEPCYIGKGRGKQSRWLDHLKARGSSNARLRNIIRKSCGKIPHVRIRTGLTNDEAIECEIALIKAIGRGPNGPLVNFTDGGDGTSGYVHTAETKEKIADLQRESKIN